MSTTIHEMQATLDRWKRRALIAENALSLAGLPGGESTDGWSDDAFLCATLQHRDPTRPVTVDELHAARNRQQKYMLR